MLIKVDIREAELIKIFENLIATIPVFKDLKIQLENLPLGDIIIYDDEKNTDILIIERKSISDLLASIKDGRYEEQSYRLGGSNQHNHNIMYIIEGDVNSQHQFKGNYFKNKFSGSTNASTTNSLEKLTAYSAMFSLNYYKGFSVFRTFNISETATFICNTVNKIKKGLLENKKPYYSETITNNSTNITEDGDENENENEKKEEINEESCKDYISVIKKIKKDNITTENIGEIMLCQIPGISSITAIAVMKKVGTISNLITTIQNDETCLKDISTVNPKGQQRKISKTCVANIIKFLKK
jgi:ERCC4-type nuclease